MLQHSTARMAHPAPLQHDDRRAPQRGSAAPQPGVDGAVGGDAPPHVTVPARTVRAVLTRSGAQNVTGASMHPPDRRARAGRHESAALTRATEGDGGVAASRAAAANARAPHSLRRVMVMRGACPLREQQQRPNAPRFGACSEGPPRARTMVQHGGRDRHAGGTRAISDGRSETRLRGSCRRSLITRSLKLGPARLIVFLADQDCAVPFYRC